MRTIQSPFWTVVYEEYDYTERQLPKGEFIKLTQEYSDGPRWGQIHQAIQISSRFGSYPNQQGSEAQEVVEAEDSSWYLTIGADHFQRGKEQENLLRGSQCSTSDPLDSQGNQIWVDPSAEKATGTNLNSHSTFWKGRFYYLQKCLKKGMGCVLMRMRRLQLMPPNN